MNRPTPGYDKRGRQYALTFINVIRHLRTALALQSTVSISEIAPFYQHSPGSDLHRVKLHHGQPDDTAAKAWLLRAAAWAFEEWVTLGDDDDTVTLKPGFTADDLRYQGRPITRDDGPSANALLRSPFDPNTTTGTFAHVIRERVKDLEDLRDSMKTFGWLPDQVVIIDENDVVIAGHRRLAAAKELGIDPVIERRTFGYGDAADAERLKVYLATNAGRKPWNAAQRKMIAERLYGSGEWSMQKIADVLHVSRQAIQKDLDGLPLVANLNRPKGGRPKGSGPKTLPQPKLQQALAVAEQLEAAGEPVTETTLRRHGIKQNTANRAMREFQRQADPVEGECRCPMCGHRWRP